MQPLHRKALQGLVQLVVMMGLALFVPAWSLRYWQAWLLLAVFTAAVAAITLHLARHDPALLARRTKAGPGAETETSQKIVQVLASLAFLAALVVPGLDHRLGWSHTGAAIALGGDGLVALGLWIVFRVFRENSFTSSTIEVGEGQRVISTGPYAIVRHPMYGGALVMMLGVPLALGSLWGLIGFVPMVMVMVWRLIDEERFLVEHLPGYPEYQQQVRYRLLPRVW